MRPPRRQLSEALAAQWAPQAGIYTDYRQMLEREELDAVTVAVPNRRHAEVTLDVLAYGAHVLVEKPMTTSAAEAQRMIDAAERAGKLFMVNPPVRDAPCDPAGSRPPVRPRRFTPKAPTETRADTHAGKTTPLAVRLFRLYRASVT